MRMRLPRDTPPRKRSLFSSAIDTPPRKQQQDLIAGVSLEKLTIMIGLGFLVINVLVIACARPIPTHSIRCTVS